MQMKGINTKFAYSSTMSAARTIIAQEGFRGLYQGMLPNYLKVVPSISISFVVYEFAKDILGAD